MPAIWKACSACKKDIPLGGKYFQCSVSTCNGKRTGLAFCSVPCFERHLPGARHKDAAAIEAKAPTSTTPPPTSPSPVSGGQRRIIAHKPASAATSSPALGNANSNEILVVVSKLKKYIQDRGGMNTSQAVMSILSDKLRALCDDAILEAEKHERKTVMDRDFK